MTTNSLQPADELRRPDQSGQLRHIFSTALPDTPIARLEIDDILEINWGGLSAALEDAITRVKHEGDLSPTTIQETLQIIALVLRKSASDELVVKERYKLMAPPTFWELIIRNVPFFGDRAERRIKEWRDAGEAHQWIPMRRDALFKSRRELAKAVDEKIGGVLMIESKPYRQAYDACATTRADIATAEEMLDDLKRLAQIKIYLTDWSDDELEEEKAQIEEKLPAFIDFVQERSAHRVKTPGKIEVVLKRIMAEAEAAAQPHEALMAALREAKKRGIYGRTLTGLES